MKYLKTYEVNSLTKQLSKRLFDYSGKKSALETIKNLIKSGADVNYQDILGDTPLINAAKSFFLSGIKVLLENGADVNQINKSYENALIVISQYPRYTIDKNINIIHKIIDLFIEYDINLNQRSIGRGYVHNYSALDYSDEIALYIMEKHPEKYEEYLMKNNTEKYNL